MSSTHDSINRKHSRSDRDGLEVSQHDEEHQENREEMNSPTKRSKVNFSARQVRTTTSEEVNTSTEVDINNSEDHTAVASNGNGISDAPRTAVHATSTETPRHSSTATDPGPTTIIILYHNRRFLLTASTTSIISFAKNSK